MLQSYWSEILNQRVSRRRALAVTASTGAAAAFLGACGGDDSGEAGKDKSGLLSRPTDTSKQAKRGGTLIRTTDADPAHLDAHGGGNTVAEFYEIAYSRLFKLTAGYLEPSENEYEGDLAESWEWSPDRLQITAKLRPGVKFHNLPPVNGRPMDTDDVLFSWNRFSTIGSNRFNAVNAVNPDAPILSVTTPDSRTVVAKFTKPLVYAQAFLTQRGYLSVVPKEGENPSVLDLRAKMLGTGPVLLADYRQSIGLTFKRHVDYWDKERSYIDQVEYPIVPEYATALAQFRAGNIHNFNELRQEDILATKRDLPQLNMYEGEFDIEGRRAIFGWESDAVRDKRVRQALSMTIARDDWIDAQFNTESFESAGLSIEKRWNTALAPTEKNEGWWLDPKGKDFGPNAKYFQRNIAEAKKLLAAAGHADGLEIISNHFTTTENGRDYVKFIDLFESMAAEAGFRFKKNLFSYTDYLRNYRDSNGRFNGIAYKAGPGGPSDDPVARLTYEFSKEGGIGFNGFDAAGRGDGSGDPYVEAELAKARVDFDTEKRRAIVHDLQRYLADAQYTIRWPGGATAFDLVWPAVRNYRLFRGDLSNVLAVTTWWLDDRQPPFHKG